MPHLLEVRSVARCYDTGKCEIHVLREVSFELGSGDSLAVIGPSGCGKTTLLNICAGIEPPSSGTVKIEGRDVYRMDEDGRAKLRLNVIGYMFQNFQLFPTLTALENVQLPAKLRGARSNLREGERLLNRLGLGDRCHHLPSQLSTGEQQRTALARALVNQPRLLLCDEPTASLDPENSVTAMELFFDIVHECGTALIVATHDPDVAQMCTRTFNLRSGSPTPT